MVAQIKRAQRTLENQLKNEVATLESSDNLTKMHIRENFEILSNETCNKITTLEQAMTLSREVLLNHTNKIQRK